MLGRSPGRGRPPRALCSESSRWFSGLSLIVWSSRSSCSSWLSSGWFLPCRPRRLGTPPASARAGSWSRSSVLCWARFDSSDGYRRMPFWRCRAALSLREGKGSVASGEGPFFIALHVLRAPPVWRIRRFYRVRRRLFIGWRQKESHVSVLRHFGPIWMGSHVCVEFA